MKKMRWMELKKLYQLKISMNSELKFLSLIMNHHRKICSEITERKKKLYQRIINADDQIRKANKK